MKLIRLMAAASVVIGMAGVTTASAKPSSSPSLSLAKHTTTWSQAVTDAAPADTWSIQIVKAAHGPAGGASLVNGSIIGLHLSDVSALSFDIQGGTGGGSPRINLGLSDSNVVFASAERQGHLNCDTSTSATWSHIDFMANATAAIDGCTLNTRNDNATNTEFTSDGTSTAWQKLAAAHPNVTITSASLIEDVGPATTYIDNLTFGPDSFTQP